MTSNLGNESTMGRHAVTSEPIPFNSTMRLDGSMNTNKGDGMSERPDPCKCHQNFAYIAPTHSGHCCFFPENSTCHADEVVAWIAKRDKQARAIKEAGA